MKRGCWGRWTVSPGWSARPDPAMEGKETGCVCLCECACVLVSVRFYVEFRFNVPYSSTGCINCHTSLCYSRIMMFHSHSPYSHSPIILCSQPSKSHMDPGMGRIIYERSGEFFFIPYAFTDVNDEREIRKGDEVSFYMAKNKRYTT